MEDKFLSMKEVQLILGNRSRWFVYGLVKDGCFNLYRNEKGRGISFSYNEVQLYIYKVKEG